MKIYAEPVTLVDVKGGSITVEIQSYDATNVIVKRTSDQKEFTIPLDRLHDDSKKIVSDWKEKNPNAAGSGKFTLLVTTGKNRRTTGKEDFDDKRINLEPKISVKNSDKVESMEAKLTVIFLGRPVDTNSDMSVLGKQSFDLTKLAPGEQKEFEMSKISSAYDNRGYAKFGARYLGYVVLIHDQEGKKMQMIESIPSTVAKLGLKWLTVKVQHVYDKNLADIGMVQN